MKDCTHTKLHCLNGYELIRKYRCEECAGVMMCACDEHRGRRFLSHQLSGGVELETQAKIAVTHGFQPGICNECRGFPPQAYPKASTPGRTSKVRRYYWRELAFETFERFDVWASSQPPDSRTAQGDEDVRKRIELEARDHIKRQHAISPKYDFGEKSQAEVIRDYDVEVVALDGAYASNADTKSAVILDGNESCDAETFAQRHFERQGFQTSFVESIPFHVLFGVFMWPLIEDPTDPQVRMVSFGSRHAYERGEPGEEIWMPLPSDFGTSGYAKRRREAIDRHLSPAMNERCELQRLFDHCLPHSEILRQYLWAHRAEDIERARAVIDVLPAAAIVKILRYLIGAYWGRYLGWPDLLVYRGDEFFFSEVKSSNDRLSEDQKRWIRDNHEQLHFPFKLVKIHRKTVE